MKATKQEQAYMGRVAELGCVICGGTRDTSQHEKQGLWG